MTSAWRGALGGILAGLAALLALLGASLFDEWGRAAGALVGIAIGGLLSGAVALVLGLVVLLARRAPGRLVFIGVVAWLMAMVGLGVGALLAAPAVAAVVLAACAAVGAGIAALRSGATGTGRAPAVAGLVVGGATLIAGAAWLAGVGGGSAPRSMPAAAARPTLELPDPSRAGPYAVGRLTYGSGADARRPEFGEAVDLVTDSVDASPLLETWKGLRAKLRARFWGFDADAMPLNGRVWYPEGKGPFPLVLMVHGNHLMHDFSDEGYAYLGELLASRGFMAVSVDQNFLNFSVLRIYSSWDETDARAWMLLEHLRVWREWNGNPDHRFHGQVDLDRVALVGHSRGGAAAAVAATFNRLGHYPDDASLAFDYGFGIRAVVAIAPADGQYLPAKRDNPLEDVSYLTLHGSHDGDVLSFMGLRQYNRTRLTPGSDQVKAALYVHRANHGQFNTRWGAGDMPGLYSRFENLEGLLDGEEQRKVAAVVIAAFLEATLRGERGYLAVLRDPRTARAWLPDTLILARFQAATDRILSTFEEDLDPASAGAEGGHLGGEGLAVWREQELKGRGGSFHTSAVYLGWSRGEDDAPPRYTLELPPGGAARWGLEAGSILTFALADPDEALPDDEEYDPIAPEDIDLTVEVTDAEGRRAWLPLSHFAALPHAVEGESRRARVFYVGGRSEPIFLTYEFPLADFAETNPAFDPAALHSVSLLFDRTPKGLIALDDLGFRRGVARR
jgi:dienelactone hydrolase